MLAILGTFEQTQKNTAHNSRRANKTTLFFRRKLTGKIVRLVLQLARVPFFMVYRLSFPVLKCANTQTDRLAGLPDELMHCHYGRIVWRHRNREHRHSHLDSGNGGDEGTHNLLNSNCCLSEYAYFRAAS